MRGPGLAWDRRVALWDGALSVVRRHFRAARLREVSTPVRVAAPAIEPYIDPIAAPPGFLATSPELAMKRLLCRGAGSMFQISHVFRAAELGALHAEEFHLIEWYRVAASPDALEREVDRARADVEQLVGLIFDVGQREGPRAWGRWSFFDALEASTGIRVHGRESPRELVTALTRAGRSPDELLPGVRRWFEDPALAPRDEDVATLYAWTELFSAWSDQELPGWLEQRRRAGVDGVHIDGFPAALAALSECARTGGPTETPRSIARRFESYVVGVELANGYRELRDAEEQRRRFECVNRLRAWLGQVTLPLDDGFLRELSPGPDGPGLPPCAGVALGLDRLLMLASGVARLSDISLALGAPSRLPNPVV